jgi:hypothetical protein
MRHTLALPEDAIGSHELRSPLRGRGRGLTFSALSGCPPAPSAPRTVVPIYEAPQGWSGFGLVTVDSRLATDAVASRVLRSATGQSTFSQSLDTGKEDVAVLEVANISIAAVVPLCVPTLRQRRAPWAR